jgi:transposase-like protein
MSEKNRKSFTSHHKAKVAMESIRGTRTVNELAQEFSVHPGNGRKSLLLRRPVSSRPSVVPRLLTPPPVQSASTLKSGG